MVRIILIISVLCSVSLVNPGLFSQGFYYNFSSCNLEDSNDTFADIDAINDTTCVCGVVDDGLFLDGINDSFFLPPVAKELFENDFTLGFYFSPEKDTDNQPIFAVQDSCDRDSLLTFRYLPGINKVELSISEKLGTSWSPRGSLDENACWHRIVLTKEGSVYSYYVDNQFVEQFDNIVTSPLIPEARIYIGSSPCVNIDDELYRGRFDELFMDTRAWSFSEIRDTDFFPDRIITNDTTIFKGNSVDILAGNICSASFFWSPLENIVDADTNMPTVTPEETTTYFLSTSGVSCTTIDSIKVNVIDEDLLNCEDLLLPNVFTPNGDQVNDQFGISNPFLIEDIDRFDIFDRYGSLVFQGVNKNSTWDGTYQGTPLMLGTYMYRVEYTCQDESFVKQGSLSLMR